MTENGARYKAALIAAAKATLGWRETSPNNAPFLTAWRADMGIHSGPCPWCVIACYQWSKAASEVCDVRNLHPCTASSRLAFNRVDGGCRLHEPVAGCFVSFELPGTQRGHEALIVERNGDLVISVDGNSNALGSRNGDTVVEHEWDWTLGRRGGLRVLGYWDLGILIP